MRKKKRARSSARKGLGKLHIRQKCMFPKNCTFISRELWLSQENYNKQNRSLRLRESAKSFSTSQKIADHQQPLKAKTTRRKRRKRRRKEERRGIMEEVGLKTFPQSAPSPPNMFLGPTPSNGRTREQHNSHKGRD